MNHMVGRFGENQAAAFLEKQGYRVLVRNYRCPQGEIDIICSQKQIIVFIEVKTRNSLTFGFPEEAITFKKQKKIRKVAQHYLQHSKPAYKELRFDVIAIVIEHGDTKINHIQAAF